MPRKLRLGVLEQDHFQYEENRIVDVVMMGHHELWQAMAEKERLLENAENEFDGERYAELEDIITQRDGYTLEARAGEILEGLGIPTEQPPCCPCRPSPADSSCGCCSPRCWPPARLPAPRRAHQPPRHPVDPLAREVPGGLPRRRWW